MSICKNNFESSKEKNNTEWLDKSIINNNQK